MIDPFGHYIGQVFGNFRLIKFIGQGGYAEVYKGEHITLGTHVAIKVLKPNKPLTNEDEQKFLQEAQRIAQLDHPHIIKIRDVYMTERIPYYVMDYAPNGSLRISKPNPILPLEQIIIYINQIAEVLQYVHDQKLIHRDIKPENLLLSKEKNILLSDFGLAIDAHTTNSLTPQDGLGSAHYMAPEQIQGKAIVASDQYAVGIIVYEWLTGTLPFMGNYPQIIYQHQTMPPSSPSKRVPTISSQVDNVVLQALQKKPEDRFSSITAFAKALEYAARKQPSIVALSIYTSHKSIIDAVAWAPDGSGRIASSSNQSVQIWKVPYNKSISTYPDHTDWINALAWSFDGQHIASASADRTVHIWEANKAVQIYTHDMHVDGATTVAWAHNGTYVASGSYDKEVHIWNVKGNSKVLVCHGHTRWIRSVAWSPDDTRVMSVSTDGKVCIWDTSTGEEIRSYSIHTGIVNAAAWSADKTGIAFADCEIIRVWDITRGQIIATHRDHTGEVDALAWSPDGKRIASGGQDATVRVWRAETGETLSTFDGHQDSVRAISWSPDGTRIASGSADKTVQVWQNN